LDLRFFGLPPSRPFSRAAAALRSLLTEPADAARQAGQTKAM